MFSNGTWKSGSWITIERESELGEIKSLIKLLLKRRSEGNKETTEKEIAEIYSIYLFLSGGSKISKMSFPLNILKREHPDFQINKDIGLEHRRATIKNYEQDFNELIKYPQKYHMLERLSNSPEGKPKFALRKYDKKENKEEGKEGDKEDELKGNGFSNGDRQRTWVETILNTIEEKTHKLNENHFEKFSSNELIVQYHVQLAGYLRAEELDEVILLLNERYRKTKFDGPLKYNKVHVFSSDSFVFIYDIFGEAIKVNMKKEAIISEIPDEIPEGAKIEDPREMFDRLLGGQKGSGPF